MPILTSYVVSDSLRELKRKLERHEELFGEGVLVYEQSSLEEQEKQRKQIEQKKPNIFVYDL